MDDETEEFIDSEVLSLNAWLALVKNPSKGKVFIDNRFPTERHSEEYISDIKNRSESEIRLLLHSFLMKSGNLPFWDDISLQSLILMIQQNRQTANTMMQFEHFRRLLLHQLDPDHAATWDGNTWILDLLPHFPQKALDALDAYILAHAQFLPDIARYGLYDAAEVIRARYIGLPGTHGETLDFLATLDSRQLECLTERLFCAIGYETELTRRQGDGGRDINAWRTTPGQREHLLIECKMHSRPVGVEFARRLLGSVKDAKANRGILLSNNRFTRGAKEFSTRNNMELINGSDLVPLLNQHLGPKWPLHIERLVQDSLKTGKQGIST